MVENTASKVLLPPISMAKYALGADITAVILARLVVDFGAASRWQIGSVTELETFTFKEISPNILVICRVFIGGSYFSLAGNTHMEILTR